MECGTVDVLVRMTIGQQSQSIGTSHTTMPLC